MEIIGVGGFSEMGGEGAQHAWVMARFAELSGQRGEAVGDSWGSKARPIGLREGTAGTDPTKWLLANPPEGKPAGLHP
jgi:hypothetical protein